MKLACPRGFRAGGLRAGLKASGRMDLTLITSDFPCVGAAMFTRNRFPGAPIIVSHEHLRLAGSRIRAIVVNSGQANACAGKEGIKAALGMCRATAEHIGCRLQDVLVSSTGVIGRIPDLKKIQAALATLAPEESESGWMQAAEGICTTDTRTKTASREIRTGKTRVRVLGIAKGSGMIHPAMATMLAFVATDARIGKADLNRAMKTAVDRSFHCLTVDGDTSTSDSIVVLANGAAGGDVIRGGTPEYKAFTEALTAVCAELAREIARDGEGATRLVTVAVRNGRTEAEARECAMAIAGSNLVKCAIFGRDPNWGRLACAVGNCNARYDPQRVVIRIGPTTVFSHGRPAKFQESVVHDYLESNTEIAIHVNLGAGKETATVWTCDFSYDYVKINAEYRT